MRKPKVSIIMGVYNCQDTVEESIESILQQTYDNWEFIICDDASTDGTYEKVLSYTKRDPERIRLIRNEHNQRLAASLNRCLAEARGDLIARQDGDDISVPDRLEKQVHFLETHPEYDVVGTAMTVFDESGTKGVRALISAPDRKVLARGTPFLSWNHYDEGCCVQGFKWISLCENNEADGRYRSVDSFFCCGEKRL